ncbi:hypothetical protein [Streptomyces sp. NPDC050145]|uniref:hypothetical protein n=1 Tax=Streptomyces sp. NPDC050145 TaxID=3365602 RepID=UPI0037A69AB3
MIFHSSHATATERPRLLPWSGLDGRACYLVTDRSGTSRLSRMADDAESVQLDMAGELLEHAADLIDDARTTHPQLRYLARRLVESLRDVHRVALSRGARLPEFNDDDAVVEEQGDR